jgi:hypothetical protein
VAYALYIIFIFHLLFHIISVSPNKRQAKQAGAQGTSAPSSGFRGKMHEIESTPLPSSRSGTG